jgi:hexosaminidase
MNQFHWHIVDSQSFPLQVPGYLEISGQGAYSSDEVYTPEDVAEVVQYAAAVSHRPRFFALIAIDRWPL